MSLIHCKKIYKEGENANYLQNYSVAELRRMEGVTVCDGFVVEDDKHLDVNRPNTEFLCLMCGRRFVFPTKKYLRVLTALGINYKERLI